MNPEIASLLGFIPDNGFSFDPLLGSRSSELISKANDMPDIQLKPFADTATNEARISKTASVGVSRTDDKGNTFQATKTTTERKLTESEKISNVFSGMASTIQAVSSVYNGYIKAGQRNMQADKSEFMARQNERNAGLMESNIKDINKAAQMDANLYKIQAAQTKSAQKVGQAASGFTVGAGNYKVMLNNTDVNTNYNVSVAMLKANMAAAENIRQAGTYRANAIINRSDADVQRMLGKVDKETGWVGGIANAMNATAKFYSAYEG